MWWFVTGLLIFGIVLMFVETFLVPGIGVAGILSLVSLSAACWYSYTFISKAAGNWVTLGVCILVVAFLVFVLRAKTWKRFELDTEIRSKVNDEQEHVAVGNQGKAITRLAPMGTAEFNGVNCEVKSYDNSMISAGTPVEIVRIEDKKVIVKSIKTE
ncbi:MAG: hypothetical protein MJY89_05140 [Bacteroidales bacterium]|nr:hypothetical protein [Bacteroidales bacterium]